MRLIRKRLLILMACFLASTVSDSNSLEFRSIGLKDTGGSMQVSQLTLFDGVAVSYGDSPEEVGPSNEIHILINMSVDVIQRQRGCVRSTNGTVSAFERWAVNGIDFITFDPESRKWTSQSPSATPVERSWNGKWIGNYYYSDFLKIQCPSRMQAMKLPSTDQNTDVRIFAKPIPDASKVSLRCHVTSSDRSLKVYLTEDGAPMVNQVRDTGPLPTGDGAVVFRRTTDILTGSNSTYGCAVQTRDNNISVLWDGLTLDGRRIGIQMIARGEWNSLPNLLMMTVFGSVVIFVLMTFGAYHFWCCILRVIVQVKPGHPPLFEKNLPMPEELEEVHTRWREMDSEEKQEAEDDVTPLQPKSTRSYG